MDFPQHLPIVNQLLPMIGELRNFAYSIPSLTEKNPPGYGRDLHIVS